MEAVVVGVGSSLGSSLAPARACARVSPSNNARSHTTVCASLHPDALKRAQERELRQQATLKVIEDEKVGKWWETPQMPENVLMVHTADDFGASVASANRTGNLVVVYYFRPDCAGCKSMFPKSLQIFSQHKDVTFIKVNAGEEMMLEHCMRMGLSRLPFFQFFKSGRIITQFTCNLTTIKVLRRELDLHGSSAQCSIAKRVDPWPAATLQRFPETAAPPPTSGHATGAAEASTSNDAQPLLDVAKVVTPQLDASPYTDFAHLVTDKTGDSVERSAADGTAQASS